MKITFIATITVAAVLTFVFPAIAERGGNLHDYAAAKKPVNIYIGEFTKSDAASRIDTTAFESSLKNRLEARRSLAFNVVGSPEEADLAVSGNIIRFIYMEHDPVELVPPLRLPIDLALDQNFARLEYEITVRDVKRNRHNWKRYLIATIEKFDMPEEKSVPLILDRAAYVFIKECFGK